MYKRQSYYGTEPATGFAYYNDIYTKIKYFTLGLHGDFNVNNFFGKKELRRWTVLLSPAVYLQKFSPKLYKKEDDKRFDTSSTLDNDVNLGLGGDIASVSYTHLVKAKYVDIPNSGEVYPDVNVEYTVFVTCLLYTSVKLVGGRVAYRGRFKEGDFL